MEVKTMELLGIWVAAFLSLAIFSFLYKDNPIYKFAEHLFVGISAGYVLIQELAGTLIPNLYHPLREAFLGISPSKWTRLGALVLGIMILLRFFKKTTWISRWSLALIIGTFAALRITGYTQSDLVKQINGTMLSLSGKDLAWASWDGASVMNNLILIIGVITVLIYFFFSVEHKTPLKQGALIGTGFLMITFGSSFGYTVLGRVSLLIGCVQDLYIYAERRYGYSSLFCGVGIIIYLILWEMGNKAKNRAEPSS